jgi:hypothetical protein
VSQAPNDGAVAFFVARAYAVLGDNEAAIAELRRSLELGYSRSEIAQEPDFTPLKKDARYQEIAGGAH